MNRETPPSVVCCDLGGVVVRICRSWAEGCDVAGLDVRGDAVDRAVTGQAWGELNRRFQSGEISPVDFAQGFSELVEGVYAPDEIIRVHDVWLRGEYLGVTEILNRLRATGVVTAVLSNTSIDHWATMSRYPFWTAAQHRLASHELGVVKPLAEAYAAVEHATGAIGAAILYFDDTLPNVQAARERGWDAVLVDPHSDPAAQIRAALSRRGVETRVRA